MLAFMRRPALLLALLLLSPILLAQDGDDVWRGEIRAAFDVPSTLPALGAKTWSTFSPMPGVLADRITYATADGMIVPAVVYRPAARHKGKLPAIVIVNGHGQDKFGWYSFYSGLLFAKAGALVLTYDTIGEGERNAERLSLQSPSPHDAPPPNGISEDVWGRRIAGLMQVDLLQALRYVATRPEVDPARIGVAGYSMGAFIGGIAGAMLPPYSHAYPDTPHFHALVLSGGGTYDDNVGYFDLNKSPCQGPPYRALQTTLGDARGYKLFVLNAERGPTLVMNGTDDTVMDIPHHNAAWFEALRQRVLAGAGGRYSTSNVFTSIMYPGVSHRPSWMDLDGVEWLNQQLQFAFWNTDEKIRAQGLTHVSEWITANHVAISKNYFREDREGGIEAVGQNFPALTRAQLTALPDAAWHKLESQLTYKAWRAKVERELTGSSR